MKNISKKLERLNNHIIEIQGELDDLDLEMEDLEKKHQIYTDDFNNIEENINNLFFKITTTLDTLSLLQDRYKYLLEKKEGNNDQSGI